MKLITPASAARVGVMLIAFLYALGKSYEVDAQPQVYPVVKFVHLSDVFTPPKHEVSADYLGGGFGVAFRRAGVTVEVTHGVKRLGCTARDCGTSQGTMLDVAWRGRRHD